MPTPEPNPLLRPLLALVELFLETEAPRYPDNDAKAELQRARTTFIEGFFELPTANGYQPGITQYTTIADLERDVVQVLAGGCPRWQADAADLERAMVLAPKLVARVFDFDSWRLEAVAPEAAERSRAAHKKLREAQASANRSAAQKARAKKKAAKKGAKTKAKKKATAKPLGYIDKKPAAKKPTTSTKAKPAKKPAAKKTAAKAVAKPASRMAVPASELASSGITHATNPGAA